MGLFDYITAEDFRSALETDYQEMSHCFDVEAWKAAHVLAGSIVEAVLLDFILAEGYTTREKALTLEFGAAITLCKDKKAISVQTADLCSVIKTYRNLIHPGRLIRLNERVNRDSAEIARALVRMVVTEIEKQRMDRYGYTAEQIVAKIRRDSSVDAIMAHLVKQTNAIEVERLLLKVVPEAHIQYLEELAFLDEVAEIPHLLNSLGVCFRTAFNQTNDGLKTKVAQRFVQIIKEESDTAIEAYGQLFFRASDLEYLTIDERDLVKKCVFSRLKSFPNNWLDTLAGIGSYLAPGEVSEFTDSIVKSINSMNAHIAQKAQNRLEEECRLRTSNEIDRLIITRLGDWINFYSDRKEDALQERIALVKTNLEVMTFLSGGDDLPF